MRQNLAFNLALEPDPNSNQNPISPIRLPKHRTLTLALTFGTDHYHEYRHPSCPTVTLLFNVNVELTSKPNPICNLNLILPVQLTKPLNLNLELYPASDTSWSNLTSSTVHRRPVDHTHPHPHIRGRCLL